MPAALSDAPLGAHAPPTLSRPHLHSISTDKRSGCRCRTHTFSSGNQGLQRAGGTRVKRPSLQDSYDFCPAPAGNRIALPPICLRNGPLSKPSVKAGPKCRMCRGPILRIGASSAVDQRGRLQLPHYCAPYFSPHTPTILPLCAVLCAHPLHLHYSIPASRSAVRLGSPSPRDGPSVRDGGPVDSVLNRQYTASIRAARKPHKCNLAVGSRGSGKAARSHLNSSDEN